MTWLFCSVQYVVSLHQVDWRPIRFAILAQNQTDHSVTLVGCMPERSDEMSEIGNAILQNMRDLLVRDIEDLLPHDRKSLFAKMADRYRWNIHLSPASETSDEPEAVARALLPRVEYVIKWL